MGKETHTGFGLLEEWLTSMKLGLILLGIIAVTAGLGTFIPQVDQSPEQAAKVGQLWQTLGFTQLYSTFWFRLLLGLLCLNLVACSARRFQGIYRLVFHSRPPQVAGDLPHKIRTEIRGDFPGLQRAVEKLLAQKGFRTTAQETATGWSFLGVRRRWGYWGSLVTHLAFVILVLGAVLSSLLGFKGYFMAGAGSIVPIQSITVTNGKINQNFSVRVNSAEKKYLPSGELDNWYSDLSIVNKNGRVLAQQMISVNHPFTYRGITFYQSDYASGVHITADVQGIKKDILLREQNDYYQAPGTDLYFVVAQVKGNEQKPLMVYWVFKSNEAQPVQQGTLANGQTANIQGAYKVTLDGYVPFTGIQVKEDPGVGVVWLGSTLLLVGLFLSFYWRPARVAGVLTREGTTEGILTLGMTAGKDTEGFLSEIKKSSGVKNSTGNL